MTTWDRESINNLLIANDKAVGRALVLLFNRQTLSEQQIETTKEANGVGFTGFDGKIGASMAKFYMRTGYLSPKQLAFWRKRDKRGVLKIGKYWKQILEEIEKKAP